MFPSSCLDECAYLKCMGPALMAITGGCYCGPKKCIYKFPGKRDACIKSPDWHGKANQLENDLEDGLAKEESLEIEKCGRMKWLW